MQFYDFSYFCRRRSTTCTRICQAPLPHWLSKRTSFCFASYRLSFNAQLVDESTIATGQSLDMLPLLSSNILAGVFLFLFSVPFPRLLICLLSRSISHLLPSLLNLPPPQQPQFFNRPVVAIFSRQVCNTRLLRERVVKYAARCRGTKVWREIIPVPARLCARGLKGM